MITVGTCILASTWLCESGDPWEYTHVDPSQAFGVASTRGADPSILVGALVLCLT